VAGAKAWQKVRYDNGFGWITGPSEFGGRGLSSLTWYMTVWRPSTTSRTPGCSR